MQNKNWKANKAVRVAQTQQPSDKAPQAPPLGPSKPHTAIASDIVSDKSSQDLRGPDQEGSLCRPGSREGRGVEVRAGDEGKVVKPQSSPNWQQQGQQEQQHHQHARSPSACPLCGLPASSPPPTNSSLSSSVSFSSTSHASKQPHCHTRTSSHPSNPTPPHSLPLFELSSQSHPADIELTFARGGHQLVGCTQVGVVELPAAREGREARDENVCENGHEERVGNGRGNVGICRHCGCSSGVGGGARVVRDLESGQKADFREDQEEGAENIGSVYIKM